MVKGEMLDIELVYIKPGRQTILKLQLPFGSTIQTALKKSKIEKRCPDLDFSVNQVGVYGHIKTPYYQLKNSDRIEIYRPLLVDPKEARRRRIKSLAH